MSNIPIPAQTRAPLAGLPSLYEGDTERVEPTRAQRFGSFLAPLALVGTVVVLAAYQPVVRAFDAVESVFGGSGKPAGLSEAQLRQAPYEVTITPATTEAVDKGVSAIGELADSQVYQGATSSSTTTGNLNALLGSEHQTGEVVGQPFKAPVLDAKQFAADQAAHPSTDFVIGPVTPNTSTTSSH
jgi:hypothetical protein